MTTEQKAKAYDKALEKAKRLYEKGTITESLCHIFPELEGSEDERIRKELIHLVKKSHEQGGYALHKWEADEMLAWLEKQGEPQDKGEISDGYHTFNELYYYRMLYNAAFFNMLPKEWVHKSKKHHDGEDCFGGGWFIVMANLPTGQISNHYELKDWDLFQIPEKEVADKWDGHTPQEAADRLHKYLLEKQDKQPSAIRWYDVSLIPQEMEELLVEWDSEDATWHEIAFYHADTKTFWNGTRQVENVTRWCYITDLLEKQGDQKSVDKEYTFKSIPRLLDMIEPTDRAKSYCKKLIDSLQTEGYSVDAKIVGECLKQMNGEKVAMAVMDTEKQDEKKSQRMVSAEAKEALYDKPTDEEMKELLRTEYEKGRADAIAEMKSSWSEKDEKVIAIINNALTESNTPPDDYDKVYDWLESLRKRIGE